MEGITLRMSHAARKPERMELPTDNRIAGDPPRCAQCGGYAVGDEVHILVKGVTNNRHYKCAGEILNITGNYAKVRYHQPWTTYMPMRETIVDLRLCKKIKRRLRHNHV